MKSTDHLHRLTDSRSSLTAALRLVALPSLGVSRSRWLLANAEPESVIAHLERGTLPPDLPDPPTTVKRASLDKWQQGLAHQDVESLVARNLAGGQLIMDAGHPAWPFALDPDPPVLLFAQGDVEALAMHRRVAIVGTRRCSAVGRSVAGEIGWTLAEHGVSVVSGLALGIDAAAHRGAGASPTATPRVGVVASGLDMVYPPRNEALWKSIADDGILLSETPMGERATRWRFPARNRLIAGLSELVIVVESHERGGALLTVDEAAARSVDVVAVPGSVLAASCRGTNQLLMDGVPPVRSGQDVVDVLGVTPLTQLELSFDDALTQGSEITDSPPTGDEQAVLNELGAGPAGVDALVNALGWQASRVLAVIGAMERANRVKIDGSVVALPLGEGD